MSPDQLITFAAVAEQLNISHAAVVLHLSQPAVSGQLKQLQDEFGEPLYRRHGRGIQLTPAGMQLAEYARHLDDAYRQARAYRDALRGLARGSLRVGASTTLASYLLPYLIAEFQRRFPDVTVLTSGGNTADIVAALASLDVAMIEGPATTPLPPGTGVHAWREDEIVAIVPADHPLVSSREQTHGTVSLEALGACPVVLREEGSGVRQIVEQAFGAAGVPMRVALMVAGVEGVKEAVRAGMGVGFVSAMAMRHEDGALRSLSLMPQPLTRRFSILVPHEGARSRVATAFIDTCLSYGAAEDKGFP